MKYMRAPKSGTKNAAAALSLLALHMVPASASELLWQSYEQPGFFATQAKSLQASELILTTLLEKINSEPHPDDQPIVMYLERLSRVCCNQSKFSEAEQYAKLAVQFSERTKATAQTIRLKIMLGNVMVKEGKSAQAQMAFEQAQRLLPSNDDANLLLPNARPLPARVLRAQALFGLALMHQANHKLQQSSALYEKALSLLKPEDGLSTSMLSNYAKCLADIGKPRAAEQQLQQILQADSDDTAGNDNPAQAATLNNLAIVAIEQKKPAQAESYMVRAVSIAKKHKYADLPNWLDNLAAVYQLEMKESLAASVQAEADLLRKKTQPPKTAAASQAH